MASKAERQAALGAAIINNRNLQEDEEPSIDDLLGEDLPPLKSSKQERKTKEKVEKPDVPHVNKGKMVSFLKGNTNQRITAPGVEYWVVRYDGKLHYKEASQCIILPDDWKEGDPIPWPK